MNTLLAAALSLFLLTAIDAKENSNNNKELAEVSVGIGVYPNGYYGGYSYYPYCGPGWGYYSSPYCYYYPYGGYYWGGPYYGYYWGGRGWGRRHGGWHGGHGGGHHGGGHHGGGHHR